MHRGGITAHAITQYITIKYIYDMLKKKERAFDKGSFFLLRPDIAACVKNENALIFFMVIKMKLIDTVRRMLSMCPEAWYIFIRAMQLCTVLLICALALLTEWNGSMTENYALYMTARTLNETAQAVLLIAVLFSVLIEDAQG